MNHAKNMYQYHVWANKALVERIKELPSNVLYEEVHSFILQLLKRSVTSSRWMLCGCKYLKE
jgi:uncharacterized damage-inducible protein DinB